MAMTPDEAEPKQPSTVAKWHPEEDLGTIDCYGKRAIDLSFSLDAEALGEFAHTLPEKLAGMRALIADANLGARIREVWQRVDEAGGAGGDFAKRAESLYMGASTGTGDKP
jgi:hypothetical protein